MEKTAVSMSRLQAHDAAALAAFYNGLSDASIRTFRPLGAETTADACRSICDDNGPERELKFDLVAWHDGIIVGWCFLWNLDKPEVLFGLGVADAYHGRGIGTKLGQHIVAAADDRGIPKVILTVVNDNHRAIHVYERLGFTVYGEYDEPSDGLTYLRMARE